MDCPEAAEGVAPQVSRLCWPLVFEPVLLPLEPVVDPGFEPDEPVFELVVELDEDELVAAPVGLELVGTTAGTEVQALSYAIKLVLDCLGTEEAATE